MSSETVAAPPAQADHAQHAPGEHAHPGDLQYVVVALVLALFTAVEVLTYFIDFKGAALPTLIGLMVVKFALVVLYFMHLKFDSPVFMRLFVTGIVLAISVYVIMLLAFEYWG
jgi:cytochrome c oxidase subunit 4